MINKMENFKQKQHLNWNIAESWTVSIIKSCLQTDLSDLGVGAGGHSVHTTPQETSPWSLSWSSSRTPPSTHQTWHEPPPPWLPLRWRDISAGGSSCPPPPASSQSWIHWFWGWRAPSWNSSLGPSLPPLVSSVGKKAIVWGFYRSLKNKRWADC